MKISSQESVDLGSFDQILAEPNGKAVMEMAVANLKDEASISSFIKKYAKDLTNSRREKWLSSKSEDVRKLQERDLLHYCYDLVKSIWLSIALGMDKETKVEWLNVFKKTDKDAEMAPQHYQYDILEDTRKRILKEIE
jgi:hypothetical protein